MALLVVAITLLTAPLPVLHSFLDHLGIVLDIAESLLSPVVFAHLLGYMLHHWQDVILLRLSVRERF